MSESDNGMWDVAIIGGGPAGSTLSTLLLKYNPNLRVLVLEKEKFPREHVGESQLPVISGILDEMGVWDKVEAANFPIKLGATYTWGRDAEVWNFDFFPAEEFVDEPRPAKFEGQRRHTAFQVERSIYDDILLRHAEEMGAQVREETMVRKIHHEGDRVTGLELDTGEMVTARHYVDGSGHVAILRRAMGVEVDAPKALRNIAIWDYWNNAKWKIEIGVGGTRVQVRSLPYGWIWFIPLSPTRASVGFICPTDYYKQRGLTPKELYHEALSQQPEISSLLSEATSATNDQPLSTKNWSHLADRLVGENWWLCGEAAGFADPILAAGLTLTHGSAREVAYSILELDRGEHDADWLKSRYDEKIRRSIRQHIRFAEYWYASNGCFTELQEHCANIAKDAGLRLNPQQAWRWLAQGGFTNDDPRTASVGGFDIGSSRHLLERFLGRRSRFEITKYNEFTLNLRNTQKTKIGVLENGRIEAVECYQRADRMLPLTGNYKLLVQILEHEKDIKTIYELLVGKFSKVLHPGAVQAAVTGCLGNLEAMYADGWVVGRVNKKRPSWNIEPGGGRLIRSGEESDEALRERAKGTVHFADEPG
ncbi:MAG: NAD(P)/FAD-dependent oxidoreductase [Planctomycetota bacterium]|nr:MAG: NAD(P)/FAD-dependent oxidoreductase [Planctomycetota bacterium]